MRLLTLSFLFFTGTGLCAQSLFQRVYDCGYGDMLAGDRVGEGSYWAYGFYDEEFGYHGAVGVVKYGADDAPVWNKVFEAPSVDVGLDVSDLTTTADGGLVWVGSRSGGLADSALVVKVTAAGAIGWSKVLPPFLPVGASSSTTAQLRHIAEAPNGDLLVAGFFSYSNGGLHRRAFLARLGADGTVQWTRSYAVPVAEGQVNYSFDVQVLSGGDILLLGGNTEYGTWLARLHGDGTMLWCKGYNTTEGLDWSGAVGVLPTSTGFNIFLQPAFYSGDIACVMHTNTNGDVQGTTKFRMAEGLGVMYEARPLADGGYVIASFTNLTGEYQGDNAHLLVVGADNVTTLSASFGVPEESEYARVVLPMSNGGYLLGGGAAYANLDDHRGGLPIRPYLVRTDAIGSYACGDPVQILVTDTVFTSATRTLEVEPITGWINSTITSTDWLNSVTVCNTVGIAEGEETVFTLSPNPASDATMLTLHASGVIRCELLNATGQLMRTMSTVGTRTLLIDLNGLTPGLYLVRTSTGSTQRLVVE